MTLHITFHKRLDGAYINLEDIKQIKEFGGEREFVIITKAEFENFKSLRQIMRKQAEERESII